jgi:hypothetical protein
VSPRRQIPAGVYLACELEIARRTNVEGRAGSKHSQSMAGGRTRQPRDITPEEAAVAASVIETKRKALETEELDRRLIALEQQLAKRK